MPINPRSSSQVQIDRSTLCFEDLPTVSSLVIVIERSLF